MLTDERIRRVRRVGVFLGHTDFGLHRRIGLDEFFAVGQTSELFADEEGPNKPPVDATPPVEPQPMPRQPRRRDPIVIPKPPPRFPRIGDFDPPDEQDRIRRERDRIADLIRRRRFGPGGGPDEIDRRNVHYDPTVMWFIIYLLTRGIGRALPSSPSTPSPPVDKLPKPEILPKPRTYTPRYQPRDFGPQPRPTPIEPIKPVRPQDVPPDMRPTPPMPITPVRPPPRTPQQQLPAPPPPPMLQPRVPSNDNPTPKGGDGGIGGGPVTTPGVG